MPKLKPKYQELTKVDDVKLNKINVFFKRSVLKLLMRILTMKHAGFRTMKSIKNINRLFTNIDLGKYKESEELQSYIWAISFFSKKWLDGIIDPELIFEIAKRSSEFDNVKSALISESINDETLVTAPEAKMIFDLIGEALQFGYIVSLKEDYLNLLDDINLDQPGAFKELTTRLFEISQSLIDIKHNTNLIANKITFNTASVDSVRDSIAQTITSLSGSSNIFKTGIRRLNTLLSPGYMNGRLYVYMGTPGSGKSMILLKSALDMRKYNPDYKPKTPGMKPCVLYVTMENTFTETIERIWNMTFDDSITNYHPDEALDMILQELGIDVGGTSTYQVPAEESIVEILDKNDSTTNLEFVMKYFSYREISTDDLFTMIQDLRDENMEVCALVLDYVKRIRPSVAVMDNVKLELDRIVNELKALAVMLDIPVITAHQINRAGAAVADSVSRADRGDSTKLLGREHVANAWEMIVTPDWVGIVNIEYKPGTRDKYMALSAVKRRRIDTSEGDLAKYTYMVHPFSKINQLKLLDDLELDQILSLESLVSDIDIIDKEKINAAPRRKILLDYDEDLS